MLPADANERSSALRNKALIQYIVRLTDAFIEKALKEKYPLQADLKANRSVLLPEGRLACLLTMQGPALQKWLMSRAVVIPSTRSNPDKRAIALTYLLECKKNLYANKRHMQAMLSHS